MSIETPELVGSTESEKSKPEDLKQAAIEPAMTSAPVHTDIRAAFARAEESAAKRTAVVEQVLKNAETKNSDTAVVPNTMSGGQDKPTGKPVAPRSSSQEILPPSAAMSAMNQAAVPRSFADRVRGSVGSFFRRFKRAPIRAQQSSVVKPTVVPASTPSQPSIPVSAAKPFVEAVVEVPPVQSTQESLRDAVFQSQLRECLDKPTVENLAKAQEMLDGVKKISNANLAMDLFKNFEWRGKQFNFEAAQSEVNQQAMTTFNMTLHEQLQKMQPDISFDDFKKYLEPVLGQARLGSRALPDQVNFLVNRILVLTVNDEKTPGFTRVLLGKLLEERKVFSPLDR